MWSSFTLVKGQVSPLCFGECVTISLHSGLSVCTHASGAGELLPIMCTTWYGVTSILKTECKTPYKGQSSWAAYSLGKVRKRLLSTAWPDSWGGVICPQVKVLSPQWHGPLAPCLPWPPSLNIYLGDKVALFYYLWKLQRTVKEKNIKWDQSWWKY